MLGSTEEADQFGLTASAAAERRRVSISADRTVGAFTTVFIMKMPVLFAKVEKFSALLFFSFSYSIVGNKCPDLGLLENGNRSTSLRSFGTVVDYSCNDGYQLVGEQTLTCNTDRSWNASSPSCHGKCIYNHSF